MSFFFLMVFLVYGGMHVYAFFRARAVFGFGAVPGIVLALFMVLMTVSPFLIRLLERNEYELSARFLSYGAYLWMAALFLYFCISLSLDVFNLILRLAGHFNGSVSAVPSRPLFFSAVGLALTICISGYWSALDIRTERLRIETGKLPAGIDRLKIVQISDVHLGLIVREQLLKKILSLVTVEQPDIFLSTGDLVDAQINHMNGLAELLAAVRAPYGKFAITGNHEYYAGINDAVAFTKKSGFKLLRGEVVKDGPITIVGVDDPASLQVHLGTPEPEKKFLTGLPKDRFTLLLKHRPSVDTDAAALFDLQLSGHTHKGQIFPFTYISQMAYPYNAGRFDLPSGSILYVSRGTGTWGPPVRFLSPPQITVIELVAKKD
jgi:hypothetical protein